MQSKENSFTYFIIIWMGDLASTIGSGLTAFSLGAFAFNFTHQATSTAMIVLCTFLPAFLLRPIGGALADRFDRMLLMICGNLGGAAGIALTAFMLNESHNLVLIYPGIIISSIFFGLQNPAYKASVSDFLPKELYSKASGLLQLSNAAQFLIAPFLGGLLMSLMDISYVLLIDIFTFIFSAIAVTAVKFKGISIKNPEEKVTSRLYDDIFLGFKEIILNRGMLLLVIVVSLLLFYVGMMQTLLTPLVLSFTNVRVLGIAQSACAIGMLITSLIISTLTRKRKNINILVISLTFMGLAFTFVGIKNNILAIIVPGFLFFAMIPFANSSIDVLIRQNIRNEMQGRVWSLVSVITYSGAMLAYAVSGFLADHIFNSLFMPNGLLVPSLGHIFGVGQCRGIAFMFFLSGILVIFIALLIYNSKAIRSLEHGIVVQDDEIDNVYRHVIKSDN